MRRQCKECMNFIVRQYDELDKVDSVGYCICAIPVWVAGNRRHNYTLVDFATRAELCECFREISE